jgi:NADH-quinone oxidoreductase subunit G
VSTTEASGAEAPEAPKKTTLTVNIDGVPFEANPGELLIAAAERAGTYIPRFCWHPRMREVGMCRMCLVEVDGPRGPSLQPSCMVSCAEGMSVNTKSDTVKKAQDGVLEFLLVNHPLDCPVCDKGGECPLQDQTLAFGPGETRFVEEKRHYEKPIPISDLVLLDRERCILCDRCTRFSKEVSGDPLIHFINRGNRTEVNTFPDDPYASYFSGNVVQICPVGALTSSTYRFAARPWDLDQVESTCTSCSVGCRVVVQSSGDRITRYQGVDSDPVNWGWLCDKGRFDHEGVASPDRLTSPQVRRSKGGTAEAVTWNEALKATAQALKHTTPNRIGVIGGARLTNEDAYAWTKLMKGVLRTDNVDAQLDDGLPAGAWLGLSSATINDACSASAVLLLGPDIKEEQPVLFIRLRDAAVNRKVPLFEIGATGTGLSYLTRASLRPRPAEVAALVAALLAALDGTAPAERQIAGVDADQINAAAAALGNALSSGKGSGKLAVVFGRQSLAESNAALLEALGLLAGRDNVVFLPAMRRANLHGALDMGMAPGLLPGRTSLSDGQSWFASSWAGVPSGRGLDTAGMLAAGARGELDVLVLLGADPLTDVPDTSVAEAAFAKIPMIVAVDLFSTDSVARADVVLPAAGYAEKSGTTTNLEGRVTTVAAKVSMPGQARPDWMIATELAAHLNADLGVESVADITAEIGRVVPAYLGVDAAIASARDGVLVPLSVAPTEPSEGSTEAESSDAPSRSTPKRISFPKPAAAAIPLPDSYSLRLVSSHVLYDGGTLVQASPGLAKLAPGSVARLNPGEIERHGLRSGGTVRVMSQRTQVVLPVEESSLVPRGVLSVSFGQLDGAAAKLIDAEEMASTGIVKVRLESMGDSR